MRTSGRRRGLWISVAPLAAVAAVLAVVLPLSLRAPAAAPSPATTAVGGAHIAAGGSSITGGRLPAGRGDTVCGDVRFDKAELPGRTATPDNGDWPTAAAADLLQLRGWPRAVPYDITRWTVVLEGDSGVLVASLPGSGFHYLPIHKAAGGGWSVGRPCTTAVPRATPSAAPVPRATPSVTAVPRATAAPRATAVPVPGSGRTAAAVPSAVPRERHSGGCAPARAPVPSGR